MRPQRTSLAPLVAFALGLVSCQFGQGDGLASVSAAPPDAERSATVQLAPAADAVASGLGASARSLSAAEIRGVAEAIRREAERFELAPDLVLAVIEVESQFDPFAVSRVGAMGLMQIRPRTGEALARRHGVAWNGPRTLFDPVVNVRLGIAYLAELRSRFGQWPIALAAYNRGPSAVGRLLSAGTPVPGSYARRVFSARERRAAEEAQAS